MKDDGVDHEMLPSVTDQSMIGISGLQRDVWWLVTAGRIGVLGPLIVDNHILRMGQTSKMRYEVFDVSV